jgi:dUTP pyrophosphatase
VISFACPPTMLVQLLHPGAQAPTYAHEGDAGMDLYLPEGVTVTGTGTRRIPLGIAVQLPSGFELQIRPRSSSAGRGLHVCFGTIDETYRKELQLIVYAIHGAMVRLEAGERIAQAVLAPVTRATIVEGPVEPSARGGLGSTGK